MMGTLARSSECSDHSDVSAHSHPRDEAPPRRFAIALSLPRAVPAAGAFSLPGAGSCFARAFPPALRFRWVRLANAARIAARLLEAPGTCCAGVLGKALDAVVLMCHECNGWIKW